MQRSRDEEPENNFYDLAVNHLFDLLLTKAKSNSESQKMIIQVSKTDTQKRASLPKEIFDYIYITKCRQLFLLVWYNNTTYSNN